VDAGRYREAEGRLWRHYGLEPVEHRLRLAGARVTIRATEVGAGPVVLLVHGASNAGASWAPLMAELDGLRCVAVDRPGCGLSEAFAGSFHDRDALDRFADGFVADVLDALAIDRAHVVGTSYGGYFALRGTAAHADRVERLVIVGWPMGAPIATTPMVMRAASIPAVGRLMMRVPATEGSVRMIFRQIGLRGALEAGRIPQVAIDWFRSLLRDTDTMRNELDAGPRLLRPIKGLNPDLLLGPALLGSIPVPALFLWGSDDPFGGATTAAAFAAQVPGATLEVVEGAGHALWLDDAEAAAASFRAFLGTVEPVDPTG
jgi:pimeloyl-ACP methyl ester carboxylesterase